MKKPFKTLGVLGAYTGIVLCEKGFDQIHEVFDFFYPGIMTLGVAAMSGDIKRLLLANRPEIENWTKELVAELGWKEFAASALLRFGETIELESSGTDANFDGLGTELEYITKHNPNAQVAIVFPPESTEEKRT